MCKMSNIRQVQWRYKNILQQLFETNRRNKKLSTKCHARFLCVKFNDRFDFYVRCVFLNLSKGHVYGTKKYSRVIKNRQHMREDEQTESSCTSLIEITKKMTSVEDELFLSSVYLISYQRNVVYNKLIPLMFVLITILIIKTTLYVLNE